jgi:hypothetical protein
MIQRKRNDPSQKTLEVALPLEAINAANAREKSIRHGHPYKHLSHYPSVFKSLTGLHLGEFDDLVTDVLPLYQAAEIQRLSHPDRQRAVGGGHLFELEERDHILLSVVWLRVYLSHVVLGYLFGVSGITAGRTIQRVLPILEQAGHDIMRMPDPGK